MFKSLKDLHCHNLPCFFGPSNRQSLIMSILVPLFLSAPDLLVAQTVLQTVPLQLSLLVC